ncbi:MAG: hypothetical protein JW778_04070 [Candidatus Altiarchaeota archaeon]|nr:hypothetical protein [Candidatus Altiarchaeota archaeon]
MIKGICYEGSAIIREDPTICDLIRSESQKDECYEMVSEAGEDTQG